MNHLQSLTDSELLSSTHQLVSRERELVTDLLEHLREVERRRLFAELGYSSMYQYCTHELGYCPASAQLRIDAMRLSKEVPELKPALESGAVTLSSIGVLQKFIRHEKKAYSPEEKKDLFKLIENKSKLETEQTLADLSPHALPREKQRVLNSEETELRFVADASLMKLIAEAKAKMKHEGDPSLAEVFEYVLKKALGYRTRPRPAASPGEVKPKPQQQQRPHLPKAIRNQVLQRDSHRCSYVSPLNAKRCQETRNLQIEHTQPYALGGSDDPANLTVLCATHNRLRAIEVFGETKMQPYLRL